MLQAKESDASQPFSESLPTLVPRTVRRLKRQVAVAHDRSMEELAAQMRALLGIEAALEEGRFTVELAEKIDLVGHAPPNRRPKIRSVRWECTGRRRSPSALSDGRRLTMRPETIRFLALMLLMPFATGCTSAVVLRHPVTGQTVKCGPYHVGPLQSSITHVTAMERERGCIEDYKQQGYVRVPD